jgi:hypothetical protein
MILEEYEQLEQDSLSSSTDIHSFLHSKGINVAELGLIEWKEQI